jgi:hypothetical protein
MRSIWAVAANTIRQVVRMKVALIFILLLVILLPTMALTGTGDNTLKGRLQTFVSYGLSLTSLLLCLLTLIVAVYTVTSDIKQRQIYTVITKPIRRSQFLLGKLLGVLLLSLALLVLFSGLIYAIVIYTPHYFDWSEDELIEADNEFFTARRALAPPEPDVSKEVAQALQRLVISGDMDQIYKGMSETKINALQELIAAGDVARIYKTMANTPVVKELTNVTRLAKRSADVGRQLLWEFENVRPRDPNGSLFIQCKFYVSVTPPDSEVYSQWLFGDYRAYQYGTAAKTPLLPVRRKDPVKTLREIEVPAKLVADDGYFAVAFLNDPLNNTSIIFQDGIKLLYKADTFTANFIRATLVIFCRLVFLACLGVFTGTFLSFPVAILFCIVIFFTAAISGFVIESFDYLSENMAVFYSLTIKLLVRLLPQFDKYGPSKYLVPAELLSWSVVGRVMLYMVCIQSLLLLIVGLIIFSFRELARIII